MTNQTTDQATTISELNDSLRRGEAQRGQVLVTQGINSGGHAFVRDVMQAVQTFDQFDADNDPYDEHDFGALEVAGQKIFFKIDYYDLALSAGSPDPADPAVTMRVLTIMLAEEY